MTLIGPSLHKTRTLLLRTHSPGSNYRISGKAYYSCRLSPKRVQWFRTPEKPATYSTFIKLQQLERQQRNGRDSRRCMKDQLGCWICLTHILMCDLCTCNECSDIAARFTCFQMGWLNNIWIQLTGSWNERIKPPTFSRLRQSCSLKSFLGSPGGAGLDSIYIFLLYTASSTLALHPPLFVSMEMRTAVEADPSTHISIGSPWMDEGKISEKCDWYQNFPQYIYGGDSRRKCKSDHVTVTD